MLRQHFSIWTVPGGFITAVCMLATACSGGGVQAISQSTPTAAATTAPAVAAATATQPAAPTATQLAAATATQPAAATATQPAPATATVASTSAPTAVPRATQTSASTASTGTPQSSSATATAGTAAISDAIKLTIDSSASQASYHARETLVGNELPTDAVGTSKSVSGSIVFGPDGSLLPDQSQVSVDLSQLQSDEDRRDNLIKRQTLDTGHYPMATFVPRQVEGLPVPLPSSGQATFQLSGDLTVHGVTKPVTWQVTAQFAGSSVTGSATTAVKITDFGMTPPKAGPVLAIEDGLTLVLDFTATRGA
jgi:polyisoprenoid-binding protein YceI